MDSYNNVMSIKNDDGHISFIILAIYVDDNIPVSNDIYMLNLENEALCQRFKMDDRGEDHSKKTLSSWYVDQAR